MAEISLPIRSTDGVIERVWQAMRFPTCLDYEIGKSGHKSFRELLVHKVHTRFGSLRVVIVSNAVRV